MSNTPQPEKRKKLISIVVPVYNEEANLQHFTMAVDRVMHELPYHYEILFVDDGSTDRSRSILRSLERLCPEVKPLLLARNYGHQIALTCGLDHADGDAVITMDGDMQHPPELIPVLLEKWEKGYDIVQTIRKATEDAGIFKRFTSAYYYKFLNLISEVPVQPGGSDFRLMDREAVLAFRQYREQDRFIRGLVGAMGFRQIQVPFVAPPRFAGHSKYSLRKMTKLALDGIVGNSVLPLRLSFYIGVLSLLVSFALFIHVMFETFTGNTVAGWATIMVCLSFFGGTELMVLGVLGEYIGRIFRQVKARPLYLLQRDDRRREEEEKEEKENE